MDSPDGSVSQQTAHTSMFDDNQFDLLASLGTTTTSTGQGGTNDTVAHQPSVEGNNDLLDDLLYFCSQPPHPEQTDPMTTEQSSGHPDLLIDIGDTNNCSGFQQTAPKDNPLQEEASKNTFVVDESPKGSLSLEIDYTDNLLGMETLQQDPEKIEDKWKEEGDSSWIVVDRGSSDDKFLSDMLFGDSAEKHKLSSSQAVPDILPDDLLNKSPDLINVHETKMDGVDDDDIFGFLEGGTENVSSNAWPSKRRHSSHSSQISTEPGGTSGDCSDQLDFSVIQDTDRLDVDAVKQKMLLLKKGSLALRKKPTRSSMKRCLVESEKTRFIDSTEPKPVLNGIADEDDNEDMFKKTEVKTSTTRETVVNHSPINKPRAPPGVFIPSLSQINTSKVLTGSPKKTGDNSVVKKDLGCFTCDTNNHFVQAADNETQNNEHRIKAKLKPVVRQSSNETPTSSFKPKLVFESQQSSKDNLFPKLKPVSSSQKPKPVSDSKPRILPRSVTKPVSKMEKESENGFSAGRCLLSDTSIDTKFNELASRIERSEELSQSKTSEQNHTDIAQTDSLHSAAGIKQKLRSYTSKSGTDTTHSDMPSLHRSNGEHLKLPGHKVSFDEPSSKPPQQADVGKPPQQADDGKPPQNADVGKPPQQADVGKHPQQADVSKHPQQADVGKHPQQADVGKHPQQADVGKPPQQADVGKPPQQADVGKHPQQADVGKHPQQADIGKHPQQADIGYHPQQADVGKHPQQADIGKHLQQADIGYHPQQADVGKHPQQADIGKHPQQADVGKPRQKPEVGKPRQKPDVGKPPHKPDVGKPPHKPDVFMKESKQHETKSVKLHEANAEMVNKPPSWATCRLKSTDEQSRKMMEDQESEKPIWLKAAQEKKQRAAEIVMAQENRSQENKLHMDDDEEEKKPSPWLGERQLRKIPRGKPLTENQDSNNSEITTPSNRMNNNTNNIIQASNNATDKLSPLKTTKPEDSNAPTGRDDYVPSWMRGSKLKSMSTPNLCHKVTGDTVPSSPGIGGEVPQWKKELVNRKKQRRESDVQDTLTLESSEDSDMTFTGGNKEDLTQDQSPGVIWKLQLKKKRQPTTSKAEVDKTVCQEPEWKRAAEEKRSRFLKSGMIEQK